MDELNLRFSLADHADVNQLRYPWSTGMLRQPAFYAGRLWEYPFALLATELEQGMQVADIGCGMTPFTIYLKDHAGCRMTGVDPDVFGTGIKYKAHGVSREFIERVLKPAGRAVLTVDMSMWFELNRPLDLIWESGLNFLGQCDLGWPARRFGMFSDGRIRGLPADVSGMTLFKSAGSVET
jgi:hypothetical protein